MSIGVPLPSAIDKESFAFRIALYLNGGLFVLFVASWVKMASDDVFYQADFTAFYTGWSLVLDGRADRLYDLEWQEAYQQRILPERDRERGLLAFLHPPHSVLLFAPLALFAPTTAFYVWMIFLLVLSLLAWRYIAELTSAWPERHRWILLLTLLGFPPLFYTFQHGQMALFLLVCLLGLVRGLKQQRPWAVAFWLVLGTVKPQLMVVPVMLLLSGRRWRELAIAAGLFSAWAALSVGLLGWECWTGYPRFIRFANEQFGPLAIHPMRMYNVKGFLTALLGSDRAGLIIQLTTVALVLNVLVVLWVWRGPWRPTAPDFDFRLAFSLLLGLLCNPHFNGADLLLLIVPALLVVNGLRQGSLPGSAVYALLLFAPLLVYLDVQGVDSWPGRVRPFFLLMAAACVWTAGLSRTWGRSTCLAVAAPE